MIFENRHRPPERNKCRGLMSHSPMRILAIAALLTVLTLPVGLPAHADPIQRMRGVIEEVEEGRLLVRPDDGTALRKFILRWKARFIPPKLPLKGDRVLILYKNKEEGAVIYGLKYLTVSPQPVPPADDESGPEDR